MDHLYLLLCFFSLITGFGAIISTLSVYFKEKWSVLLVYALCLYSVFIMIFGIMLKTYFRMNSLLDRELFQLVYYIFVKGGLFLLVISIPVFTDLFFNLKFSKLKTTLLFLNTMAAGSIIMYKYMLVNNTVLVTILQYQLFAVFIYMVVTGIVKLKNLDSPVLRKISMFYILILIFFMPALTPLHFLTPYFFSFFYMILSLSSIFFAFTFFIA